VLGERQRLMLAGENHRHTQLQASHDRRSDARGLDGDDASDALVAEQAGEFLANLLHQDGVDLMVQKGVDLQNPVGEDDAFIKNLLFQLFHKRATSSWTARYRWRLARLNRYGAVPGGLRRFTSIPFSSPPLSAA